jgi:hypothetical protein
MPVTTQQLLIQIFTTMNTGEFYEKLSSHLILVETKQK